MTTEVDLTADVIDSRDVIEEINELEALDDARDADDDERLALLKEIDGEGYNTDWTYGATLIRDSYFVKYAQELAEEIGAIPDDASWPATCIDWEQAARELQMDYTSITIDGTDYWVR